VARKSYEDSARRLGELGYIDAGQAPATPRARRPRYDDEEVGVQFFRTEVLHEDLSNLTLPATYFARSGFARTSFRNTDLQRSTLCWNDFVEVDFRDACLADCDLRSSEFEGCQFDGADMRGALLTTGCPIALTAAQRETVVWSADEPDGG
jgi:BTB/POZ domain-containing protein KCTD9